MRSYGVDIPFVDALAGSIVGSGGAFFVAQQATWDLVSTLAEDLIIGKIGLNSSEIVGLVIQQVRTHPELQGIIGMSIAAAGAFGVWGNSLVGLTVFIGTGPVSAFTAVALVALANVVLDVYQILTGSSLVPPGPAAALSGDSHFFRLSVASDYYVMDALMPDWLDAPAAGSPEGPDSTTPDWAATDEGPTRLVPLPVDFTLPVEAGVAS